MIVSAKKKVVKSGTEETMEVVNIIEIESSMKIGDCHRDWHVIVSAKKKVVKIGTEEIVNVIPVTTIIGSVLVHIIVPETVIDIEIKAISHTTQTHDF